MIGGLLGLVLLAGAAAPAAPEFPTQDPRQWVGTPVTLRELRGRVVLLDVWTFG
jgi:hypothetical protein